MKPVTGNFTGYRLTGNRFTTLYRRQSKQKLNTNHEQQIRQINYKQRCKMLNTKINQNAPRQTANTNH